MLTAGDRKIIISWTDLNKALSNLQNSTFRLSGRNPQRSEGKGKRRVRRIMKEMIGLGVLGKLSLGLQAARPEGVTPPV
jgi:hypothetical protein